MLEKIYLVLYELSILILKFTLINVFWFLVNIPVVILAIQLYLTTEFSNLLTLIPLLTLLLPLVFFPTTNALISTTRNYLLESQEFKFFDFFQFLKQGYKNSFIIGVFYTGLATAIGYLVYLSYTTSLIIVMILAVFFIYLSMNTLCLLFFEAHFNMTLYWKFRQSLLFIAKYPLFALVNFMIFTLLHYIVYSVSYILFLLFGEALIMYATYYLFLKKLDRIKRASKQNTGGTYDNH
ncbi:DUF624 domain-containing protein [Alkalibacterium kapii]|uniref:DUF624 domain-containing protein n=1 Tax=Alkalibacterium kapii TaxID=426704 RepID=A0A511AUW2_9LACT|nr:DUF624 domain-containing protein [Alkalibacterium kapii]GEK91988.1 hypothetical protein AKA01nite_16100 [Alkalibacterium kapii]